MELYDKAETDFWALASSLLQTFRKLLDCKQSRAHFHKLGLPDGKRAFNFSPGSGSQGQVLRATVLLPRTSRSFPGSQCAPVSLLHDKTHSQLSKPRAGLKKQPRADLLSTSIAPGCSTGSNKNKLKAHINSKTFKITTQNRAYITQWLSIWDLSPACFVWLYKEWV